jgi:hypothetical protein
MKKSRTQMRDQQKRQRLAKRSQSASGLGARPRWTPFDLVGPQTTDFHLADGEVYRDECDVYLNSRYKVAKYDDGEITHLSIKRLDGQALQDWRELQRIKNELLGEEIEAVQLHPAESRLLDMCDQVHLWALKEGRFAFGFEERIVSEGTMLPGQTQRPFEEKPTDLIRMADFVGNCLTQ